MSARIPVTVITGFLGSGKTTLIRHLLQNNQGRRIAVIVNEFGELGIDGELLRGCEVCPEEVQTGSAERSPISTTPISTSAATNIIELTNGCLCCTVQEEFLPTMQALLERRAQLDHILIETSGLALPAPLVRAFRWPEIRNAATVDGVLTVVDCAAVAAGEVVSDPVAQEAARQADPSLDHETPLEELFEDQLACADLVILNKSDLVSAADQQQVLEQLRPQLSARVKTVTSAHGQLSASLLLGFNAAVEDDLEQREGHHSHAEGEDHEHDEGIISVPVVLNQEFDPDRLQAHLEALVQQQEIYRIKGFVAVPGKAMRLVMQGVGKRFDRFYDRPWLSTESRQTRLIFIGRGLEAEPIRAGLLALPV
ncbi:cobalamin biosynthesis protein CobW [Leptolyngbya sp. FACHB-261]|uniref:cobalamin biosynthesis protein CobW n=1 Tax=Leptolyngbya sp. FACHB-261 TaxID=2692806 RepID=UPI001687678A|nr:cobalamin biosynthesis protein CobW [Leptolyngbya sp. FACHB-261]MBD2103559.1 cobalamin biosynthesis protein CobW [Leptolyngbya sp. FACHB-261]